MQTNSIDERIEEVLEKIQKDTSGLLGFVLFTMDGFPIKSTLTHSRNSEISEQELFSAIGAGLISLAEKTLKQIGMMPLDKLTIESSNGNIVVERVTDSVGIMALALPTTPLGMIRIAVQNAKEALKSLLQ